ncbi:hypothetical protein [Paenibacillus sp. FJAT-26967]|uniref:hypothetical protein n=1 Tax=Paenibacillus sp. FJAT-26967 TaxID=1729690 RepID=UPI0008398E48|nr:hypothetical protein [Paenibacillus sp. FJAT-26967]
MQPITAKELEYIADSMSNEDLLIKQSINALVSSQNPAIQQFAQHSVQRHQHHYSQLMNALHQHINLAPTQPQQQQQQ